MTEEEWLDSSSPAPRQLAVVHEYATVRKLQLIAAAFVRGVQERPEHADAKRCEDLIEEVADQVRPWESIRDELMKRPGNLRFTHVIQVPQDPATVAMALRTLISMCSGIIPQSVSTVVRWIHEVVGNPFRPVAVDPRWLTSKAVGIAQAIYDERAFDRLPILADALQDAGCEDADVLAHCRGDGPHVRGCWVVDLVLGKQ